MRVVIEGPSVKAGRIGLRDLAFLAGHIQTGVFRVAEVLVGDSVSDHRGRKPSRIESACRLALVAVESGSVGLLCDLERDDQGLIDDLGEEAVKNYVIGIGAIGRSKSLPKGFDRGVLDTLKESGAIFSRGVAKITYDYQARQERWRASYDSKVLETVARYIAEPIVNKRTIEGRLLMGDFKEGALRCRIHPPMGRPVTCQYLPAMKDSIRSALTSYIRATGEASEGEQGIESFVIHDLDVIDDGSGHTEKEESPEGFFDTPPSIEDLAAKQGVIPIGDIHTLAGDFWPEDESLDEFASAIERWRRGKTDN